MKCSKTLTSITTKAGGGISLTVYLSSPVLGQCVRFLHGITSVTPYHVLHSHIIAALNVAEGVLQAEVGLLVPGNDLETDAGSSGDPLGRVKRGYSVPVWFVLQDEGDWNVFVEDQVVGFGGTLVALKVQVFVGSNMPRLRM